MPRIGIVQFSAALLSSRSGIDGHSGSTFTEEKQMMGRALAAICLIAFVFSLGCDGGGKSSNSSNLEYSKEGPPKRDNIPAPKGK